MHATITAMAKSKKKSNDPLGVTEQANELCFTQSWTSMTINYLAQIW